MSAGTAAAIGVALTGLASGVPVSDAEFSTDSPWMVAVVGRQGDALCAGTVIAPRWVLTAAHCAGMDVDVRFGDPSRRKARRVAVREVIIHPQFTPEPLTFDLGLLRLARPLRVRPLPLATRAESWGLIRLNSTGAALGWGALPAGAGRPDRLQRGEVIFEEIRIVGSHLAFYSPVGGPCGGDSGGPLVIRGYDGEPVLAGVASVTDGDLCAAGGGVAGYSDVVAMSDFIQAHVEGLPERLPPVEFRAP